MEASAGGGGASSSSSSSSSNSSSSSSSSSSENPWSCSICLSDSPTEPVVTPCGHLYCWPCIFKWLESDRDTCPDCKAGITKARLVPIYSRGGGRQRPSADSSVPPRPAQPRTEAPSQGGNDWAAPQVHFGLCVARARRPPSPPQALLPPPQTLSSYLLSLPHRARRRRAFGFFPALVVNLWANHRTGREGNATAMNPAALLMERVTFSVGALLVFFLLFG